MTDTLRQLPSGGAAGRRPPYANHGPIVIRGHTPVVVARSSAESHGDDLLGVLVTEPISPELVLIDPDLARRARAQLSGSPVVRVAPAPRHSSEAVGGHRGRAHGDEPRWMPSWSRGIVRAAAAILVVVAGALTPVALSAFRGTESRPTVSPARPSTASSAAAHGASVPLSPSNQGARPSTRSQVPRPDSTGPSSTARPHVLGARVIRPPIAAIAERKILQLLPLAPRAKVPTTLVDRRVGVVRTNVNVVCRGAARRDWLDCVVRPARHRPGEGLKVRYRALTGGRAKIVWGPYRR